MCIDIHTYVYVAEEGDSAIAAAVAAKVEAIKALRLL